MKRFQSLSRNARIVVIASGVLAAVVLIPLAAFALDELRTNGEVPRNVTAAGVDISGLGHDDAIAAMRSYEAELGAAPLTFRVADSSFEVVPSTIGLAIDEEAIVSVAMEQRRDENFLGRFANWFGSFSDDRDLDVPVAYEPDLLDDMLDEWELSAINNPAFEGGLIVSDGRVLPDYPRSGEGIDRPAAQAATAAAIQSRGRSPITLTTLDLEPVLTPDDIEDAARRANRIIDSPVILRANDPEVEVEIPAAVLARALTSDVQATEPPRVDLSLSTGPIARTIEPFREAIEQPPRDAEFIIGDDDVVTLAPSRPQTLLDINLVVDRILDVADRGGATGTFPFRFGQEAAFTTEMAEAMGEVTLVSDFTTGHSCCQPRVTNIQTMADAVDGAVVWPGEQFDLNIHVGERTVEKGYVSAPMILRGEIVDDIGGGVSQFATTIYNAAFFGCYEDVEHRPHSFYFSRYPEGREATVSWGGPELIIGNDTEAPLIIKTEYTSRSITVKFFGNTGGRNCTDGLGDRYRFTDPPTQFEEDPTRPPGQPQEIESGGRGWTIDIFRFIVYADGTDETEVWSHRYSPRPKVIRAHPCDVEDAPSPCLVAVPDTVGMKRAKAVSLLETWSFTVNVETVAVEDESQDRVVQSQIPAGGAAHELGAAVTIRVGEFTAEPEPDLPGRVGYAV